MTSKYQIPQQTQQQPCRTCGTCPTCGRQPNQFSPDWTYRPQPFIPPVYWTTPPQMPYYRPTFTVGDAWPTNTATISQSMGDGSGY